jgi:hypothetical protein
MVNGKNAMTDAPESRVAVNQQLGAIAELDLSARF